MNREWMGVELEHAREAYRIERYCDEVKGRGFDSPRGHTYNALDNGNTNTYTNYVTVMLDLPAIKSKTMTKDRRPLSASAPVPRWSGVL